MKREQILKETSHFIVINKPSGFNVEKNRFERAMEDFTEDYLKKSVKNPFVGVVHRLDKVTSGALIFAKKQSSLKDLNRQLEQRKVRKSYLAIIDTPPPKTKAFLKHFIDRDFKKKKAVIYTEPTKGAKECRLRFRQIAEKDGKFLLDISPETGKFHQIRAQLAFIGCPIVGDEKYGSKIKSIKGAIALHASKLTFLDSQKKEVKVEAPLPDNDLWTLFR